MNVEACYLFQILLLDLLRIYSELELLNRMVIHFFEELPCCFPQNCMAFFSSLNVHKGFNFSTTLSKLDDF